MTKKNSLSRRRLLQGAGAATISAFPAISYAQAEVIKKAADAWNRTRLTPRVKSLFAWWLGVRR